jgi:hypothetical protein
MDDNEWRWLFFDRPKRPLWKEEGRWLHDLFKGDLQAPKSREELIALYGYDIRTKDKPPDEPPKFMKRWVIKDTETNPQISWEG